LPDEAGRDVGGTAGRETDDEPRRLDCALRHSRQRRRAGGGAEIATQLLLGSASGKQPSDPPKEKRLGDRGPRRGAPATLKGVRDRALLLLGFAGAFRRSELVALDVADLQETDDGFRVLSRRSKTDQEGHGETIAIVRGHHACPVKAVKAWLSAAGITAGPLFRPVAKGGRLSNQRLTDKSVCDIVKAYAGRLGLKAAEFGAHSLRAGFLTSAARRGASVFKMRDVSRHKSMDVLQAYVRDADLFKDHAGIGLL
jgi:integrase